MTEVAATDPSGATSRWNRFWQAQGYPLSLGIFRFLFALALLTEIETSRAKSLFAIEGGFHFPYLSIIKPVPDYVYHALHNLQYPFAGLLALGLFPRLSAGTLLGLQGYIFFADRLNFRNHPYFFLLLLLLLTLSRHAGGSFSIPALLRGRRTRDETIAPLTIQRVIQVQVSIVYFFAALHKMTAWYLGGNVLAEFMTPSLLKVFTGAGSSGTLEAIRIAIGNPRFWVAPAWITVLLELSLPVALWIPRVRPVAMILGIGFHLIIAFTMSIYVFSAAMISSYVLFLEPETLPRLVDRWRPRLFGTPPSRPLQGGANDPAKRSRKTRQKPGRSG